VRLPTSANCPNEPEDQLAEDDHQASQRQREEEDGQSGKSRLDQLCLLEGGYSDSRMECDAVDDTRDDDR